MAKILFADDDTGLRKVISYKLKKKGYDVIAVEDGPKALERIKYEDFDLLLTDNKMPGMTGLELLEAVKKLKPEQEVIVITAHGEINQAVEAMKQGALDYLPKPFEDEQLFIAIEKAIKYETLQKENKSLKKKLEDQKRPEHIPGISAAYKNLIKLVERVAPTDATVLLTGESGTGKEVIARMIHQKSKRHSEPFVAINCAAIPRELLESELFGHTKGAFTGAIKDKKGSFELAEKGTLFLDEIGELPYELQAKLLRSLQERVIVPVGAEKKKEIDIRVISATNTDLKQAVSDGNFREDLFYRLNVIPIDIPPLRDRKDDIAVMARRFVEKFSPEHKISLDKQLLRALEKHNWPGNVRELENLIERMVVLRSSDNLTVDDLPNEFETDQKLQFELDSTMSFDEVQKKMIYEALEKANHNKSKAAKLLKIPRHILVYRMKKFGLFYQN